MAVIIQMRRSDAAVWASSNPTLAQGEMGVELDTGRFKVGNGTTEWNSLAYSSGDDGVDGSVWHSGTGEPGVELGVDGDYYLDTADGSVHRKNGTWSVVANIKGENDAAHVSFDKEGTDIGSDTVQGAIEELDAREVPASYDTLALADDVTGEHVLNFRQNTYLVVEQGEGAITYSFASLAPPQHQYENWDPDVWNFGTKTEYPTLKGVN